MNISREREQLSQLDCVVTVPRYVCDYAVTNKMLFNAQVKNSLRWGSHQTY